MKNKVGKYFWRGIKHQIPLCCIIFFETEWQSIRKMNKEYGNTMDKLTNNQGVVMCPNCLVTKIMNCSPHFELV
jgi:hypothetical protein